MFHACYGGHRVGRFGVTRVTFGQKDKAKIKLVARGSPRPLATPDILKFPPALNEDKKP